MTRGTHSRSFGCVIHPFPRDTCHPSFHDTSTVVTSYDIRPPRHFKPTTLEISKHNIHKLPKPKHPKSRSESGPSINKDTWRTDLPLRIYDTSEDCTSKEMKTPEAQTPEVNLDHPDPEATWRQISHFGNTTLWRMVRTMH
jgi:hypothetical protein